MFVGGLDYTLTDQEFRDHFERFGHVKDAQIVREPATGTSRGFGFVTFHNDSIAKRLITEI